MRSRDFETLLAGAVLALLMSGGCTQPVEFGYCSAKSTEEPEEEVAQSPTWHADVRPIVEGRCQRCHRPGDIAPFPLTSYSEVFAQRALVRDAVVNGRMPPWMPAHCCNEFQDDFSLNATQIETIDRWVEQGAPEGDPSNYDGAVDGVGGLSRVDVTVEMDEGYTPEPEKGRVDDFRCFVLDWPLKKDKFIAGMNPLPGAREIVHHLIVAVASGSDVNSVTNIESPDGKPGFPCEGGFGDVEISTIIGGGLHGADYPGNLGRKIPADSKIVLQIHYSMANSEAVEDKTGIEFRLEDEADDFQTIPIANPAWLMGDGMRIPAGAKNKSYSYQFDPRLYTGNGPVKLWGATPHMHYFGQKFIIGIVRDNGQRDCVLEIPRWDFGWEQPYWFKQPIRLNPGDELYMECQFNNTREKQPIVDGKHQKPRDIAWGTDNQDMCAGFVQFTKIDE